jgi:glutamate 5-kinase
VGTYIVEISFFILSEPLGTSSIVHETTHQPLLSTLSAVVETVVDLKRHGHKVVLVSSGAIGVGLKRMNMESRPKNLSGKQVCVPFFVFFFFLHNY